MGGMEGKEGRTPCKIAQIEHWAQRVTLDAYNTCDMSDSTNQITELTIGRLQCNLIHTYNKTKDETRLLNKICTVYH
jgi:hypothetical protein